MHAFAQIGIRQADHARLGVALHLLDGGFGRQAVANCLFELPHPAAVVGKHAVGFENLAMFAFHRHIAPRERSSMEMRSESSASGQPLQLEVGVFIEQIGDDDARLVQHDMAKPDTFTIAVTSIETGRDRSSSRPGRVIFFSSPVAIISAMTIAVVSIASTSSSR